MFRVLFFEVNIRNGKTAKHDNLNPKYAIFSQDPPLAHLRKLGSLLCFESYFSKSMLGMVKLQSMMF
jgi:hypothetical protein